MKSLSTRDAALPLVALVALAVYILACTSFSPDDKRVLYPAFDENGSIGVAVYDREARRSELLFVPASYGKDQTNIEPCFVRGRWLADGRALIAWAGGDRGPNDTLGLAAIPVGAGQPIKVFIVADLKEPGYGLSQPLPVSGDNVFVPAGDDTLLRLNLRSGIAVRHQFAGLEGQLSLYANPSGEGVYYLLSPKGEHREVVFGQLDPERLTLAPMTTISNSVADGSFFTFDRQGSRVAFVENGDSNTLQVVVLKNGQPELRKPIPYSEDRISFGNAAFSPAGDSLRAAFGRHDQTAHKTDFGLLEIPLTPAGTLRETVLLSGVPGTDRENALYFQIGCSHDGKTAAVASTYLAADKDAEKFRPEDCALFFVDLSSPERKVSIVPIMLPKAKTIGK